MTDFRAYRLAQIESNFAKTLNAAGRQFSATAGEFPGVVRLKSLNTSGYWYGQPAKKDRLALHGTAGVLSGDLWQLTQQDNHVSVGYVVARDGTAYQLFPDECWSYHLGPSSSMPNSTWSTRSVAIEISNLLGLTVSKTDSNVLLDTYNRPYCTLADTQFYTKLGAPYRGFSYWASFTDAQYEAVANLTRNLCDKLGLKPTTLAPDQLYQWQPKLYDNTVFVHSNVRKDKLDFGPNFDLMRALGVAKPTVQTQPAPTQSQPAPTQATTYTVQSGDTLSAIAQSHHCSLAALEGVNPGIDPNRLQIGQQLKLP